MPAWWYPARRWGSWRAGWRRSAGAAEARAPTLVLTSDPRCRILMSDADPKRRRREIRVAARHAGPADSAYAGHGIAARARNRALDSAAIGGRLPGGSRIAIPG